MGVKRGNVRRGTPIMGGNKGKGTSWSKAAIAAAKACSGIALAKTAPARGGRRGASIARVVRAYYLG